MENSFIQKFLKAILPQKLADDMEAKSRSWMLKCPDCKHERSYWEMGGTRPRLEGGRESAFVKALLKLREDNLVGGSSKSRLNILIQIKKDIAAVSFLICSLSITTAVSSYLPAQAIRKDII